MKYQHVADIVVELYSCAKCLKGVWGRLNGTKIHQNLSNNSSEESLSWKFSILQFLKNRTLTNFELQDWYLMEEI